MVVCGTIGGDLQLGDMNVTINTPINLIRSLRSLWSFATLRMAHQYDDEMRYGPEPDSVW